MDLFDRPETCQRYWKRLCESIAFDAVSLRSEGRLVSVSAVYDALERAIGAASGDFEKAARILEVSPRGLRLRMTQLELPRSG